MTFSAQAPLVDALLRKAPVVPVIVIDDPAHAAPLARTLVAAGMPVLEVTLRTPAAFECIAQMLQVEGALVGAGTVTTEAELENLNRMGAHFVVSPGITSRVLMAAEHYALPLLPGVQTTSELMLGREHGLRHFKFFPAVLAGGPAMLAAWAAPFPDLRFCPTGGITPSNAWDYLCMDNVMSVGSTWVAPRDWIAAERWEDIAARAREALAWKPALSG